MSPSRPNGVVNFFVVNAYRVVSEFVVISGKLFREHWSTFSLTFTISRYNAENHIPHINREEIMEVIDAAIQEAESSR